METQKRSEKGGPEGDAERFGVPAMRMADLRSEESDSGGDGLRRLAAVAFPGQPHSSEADQKKDQRAGLRSGNGGQRDVCEANLRRVVTEE